MIPSQQHYSVARTEVFLFEVHKTLEQNDSVFFLKLCGFSQIVILV